MHFVVLIIIPREIYEKGDSSILDYIDKKMSPYDSNTISEETCIIEMTSNALNKIFDMQKECKTTEEFLHKLGYELDSDGNAISQGKSEHKQLFDWYKVGGRWNGILTSIHPFQEESSESKQSTLSKNSVPVAQLVKNDRFPRIIDRNGQLFEHKQADFPFSDEPTKEENGEWQEIFERVLRDASDDYIVNLDCHG